MPAHRFTLWPGGLVGRVILVLLAALALEFLGSALLYEQTATLLPTAETLNEMAGRLVRTRRELSALPPALRPDLARAASGDGLDLAWTAGLPQDGETPRTPLPLRLLQGRLMRLQPELGLHDLNVGGGLRADGLFRNVSGTLLLDDGSALRFAAPRLVESGRSLYETLLTTALFAGGILLAAAMVVHTLTAPLRRLARVAGAIGRGPPVHVDHRRGPREVREVARAMNAMQSRIAALVDNRTAALAAVSHDLRTPIARMRLRMELLASAELQASTETDLAEMEQMIAGVLAYLGGETSPEAPRSLDLASILQTLVDDATDRGAAMRYAGPDQCRIQGRPLEIKRALGNLVENARKYGGAAVEVSLAVTPGTAVVQVADRGPGIPEADMARVLEPFQRVDTSRNAGLGGIGLGLAIVRRTVERDGGRLILRNRPGGGLCAEVTLPAG